VTDGSSQHDGQRPSRRHVAVWLAAAVGFAALLVILGPGFASLRGHPEPEPVADVPAPEPGAPGDWGPVRMAALGDAPALEAPAPGAGEPPVPAGAEAGPVPATALDCIIEPSRMIDVRSPVRGRIAKIHLQRSELAEQGQVLVELDASVEQAQVDIARMRARMEGEIGTREARLALGESRRRRASDLYQGDALSVDRREEAETEAEVARRELEQARENREAAALELRRAVAVLERRTIRSPIAGYVVENLLQEGEVVDEETILRLAQIDPLQVEVILPSSLYGSVRAGMRGEVTPEVPGAQIHVAQVTVVDKVVDAASSTFGVRLALPNPDHAIPGGLRCQVRFLED